MGGGAGQETLDFEYANAGLCHNNTRLLVVLDSDAALLVNLQIGVICITRCKFNTLRITILAF